MLKQMTVRKEVSERVRNNEITQNPKKKAEDVRTLKSKFFTGVC